MAKKTKAKKKPKGHPGFALKCRKVWSFKRWERCVKDVKKSKTAINPYQICNSQCLKMSRRRKSR